MKFSKFFPVLSMALLRNGFNGAVRKEYITTEGCYPLRDSLEFHGGKEFSYQNSVFLCVLRGKFLLIVGQSVTDAVLPQFGQ
jgi:hypothetical protein